MLDKTVRNPWQEIVIVGGLMLLFATVIPQFLYAIGQGFRVGLLGRFMALGIAALGIDLIWGYTGMLSLGHGIFFALGGYAFAMFLLLQLPAGKLPDFFSLNGVTRGAAVVDEDRPQRSEVQPGSAPDRPEQPTA